MGPPSHSKHQSLSQVDTPHSCEEHLQGELTEHEKGGDTKHTCTCSMSLEITAETLGYIIIPCVIAAWHCCSKETATALGLEHCFLDGTEPFA